MTLFSHHFSISACLLEEFLYSQKLVMRSTVELGIPQHIAAMLQRIRSERHIITRTCSLRICKKVNRSVAEIL